jgi:hypothetical protein
MSTIRKTISISKKDEKLQEIIKDVPNYEVSHVIRQLMYDGLKYRTLVEEGVINDFDIRTSVLRPQKEQKQEEKPLYNREKAVEMPQKEEELHDFEEEIDINSVKLEEIDEKDEDLEDLLLNNS